MNCFWPYGPEAIFATSRCEDLGTADAHINVVRSLVTMLRPPTSTGLFVIRRVEMSGACIRNISLIAAGSRLRFSRSLLDLRAPHQMVNQDAHAGGGGA